MEEQTKLKHLIIDLEDLINNEPNGDNLDNLETALALLREVDIYKD